MKPSICRIVIFRQGPNETPVNGTREHPAVITRVLSDTCVNLQVFFDTGPTSIAISVQHESVAGETSCSWSWPKREG